MKALFFPVDHWVDSASGWRVRRLTQDGINISPYFNGQGWSADGRWVFYIRIVGGEAFVAASEIETGECRLLHGPFPVPQLFGPETDLNWATFKAIPGANAVSYTVENALWRADLDGGPRKLYDLPYPRSIYCDSDISGDGQWHTLAAIEYDEEGWKDRGNLPWPPDPFFQAHVVRSTLFRVALDGSGRTEELFEVPGQPVSHISVCPTDPDTIVYCHEGNVPFRWGRMFLRRVGESESRPLRDQRSGRVHVTHENWFRDGQRLAYHGYYQDDPEQWPPYASFVGIYDVRRDLPEEFILTGPRRAFSHTIASPDGSRFFMDFLPHEKGEPQCLYEVHLDRATGAATRQAACSVASDMVPLPIDQWRTLDPIFSPDGGKILFRAASEGECHIYVLEVKQR